MKYLKLFEDYSQSNINYSYAYNCVSPESLDELDAIIDHMYDNEVTNLEFLELISFEDINHHLPVTYNNAEQLINDYHVKYYVGEFYFDENEDINREFAEEDGEVYNIQDEGKEIKYAVVVHSAIEHVWKGE